MLSVRFTGEFCFLEWINACYASLPFGNKIRTLHSILPWIQVTLHRFACPRCRVISCRATHRSFYPFILTLSTRQFITQNKTQANTNFNGEGQTLVLFACFNAIHNLILHPHLSIYPHTARQRSQSPRRNTATVFLSPLQSNHGNQQQTDPGMKFNASWVVSVCWLTRVWSVVEAALNDWCGDVTTFT